MTPPKLQDFTFFINFPDSALAAFPRQHKQQTKNKKQKNKKTRNKKKTQSKKQQKKKTVVHIPKSKTWSGGSTIRANKRVQAEMVANLNPQT